MNEDVLKPFPCKENGCSMSFFTEDHLSVHSQAKHGKLNLEIPKGSNIQIFSDQTPTPTRLLNNCEELRVFDDLQNINPFEEGFRRAVEDNSNGFVRDNCFLTTPSNQDTLHTPQILPQFELNNLHVKHEPQSEIPIQEEPENLTIPTTLEDASHIPKVSRETSSTSYDNDLKFSQKVAQPLIPLLPKPNIIYAAPIISAPTTMHLTRNVPQDISSKSNESVKDKLKNILLNNSGAQADRKRIKIETEPSTIFIGAVPLIATTPVNNLIINNTNNNFKLSSNDMTQSSDVVTAKTSENSNGSRKRSRGEKSDSSNLKVERNRAAARRYRTKMKIQSQALQEKHEKSLREIASLKKELTDLKKELTQVKTLLLLHKDCSVSKAMATSTQQAL